MVLCVLIIGFPQSLRLWFWCSYPASSWSVFSFSCLAFHTFSSIDVWSPPCFLLFVLLHDVCIWRFPSVHTIFLFFFFIFFPLCLSVFLLGIGLGIIFDLLQSTARYEKRFKNSEEWIPYKAQTSMLIPLPPFLYSRYKKKKS